MGGCVGGGVWEEGGDEECGGEEGWWGGGGGGAGLGGFGNLPRLNLLRTLRLLVDPAASSRRAGFPSAREESKLWVGGRGGLGVYVLRWFYLVYWT